MRIRTIKPEFWTDSLMVSLPRDTRLVFIGLLNAADDYGWLPDDMDHLRMELFPGDPTFPFSAHVDLLLACERLERFVNEGGRWMLSIAHWSEHQRVDKPSKSKIAREGSRKLAIPQQARRDVAKKYGCQPGEKQQAKCFYCDSPGVIHWMRLYNGRPSAWVYFEDLQLDHLEPEACGGEGLAENIVLACEYCNKSKHTKSWFAILAQNSESIQDTSRILANPRESSTLEWKGKDQGMEQGNGREGTRADEPRRALSFSNTVMPDLETWLLRADPADEWEEDWWTKTFQREAGAGWTMKGGRKIVDWCLRQDSFHGYFRSAKAERNAKNAPPDHSAFEEERRRDEARRKAVEAREIEELQAELTKPRP